MDPAPRRLPGAQALLPPARFKPAIITAVISVIICASLWLPAVARGEPKPPGPEDARAIRQVIETQLAAFRRDDAEAAFAQAAPSVRRIFRTPERFMAMVMADYRPVYRPDKVSFLKLIFEDGRTVQQMLFVNAEDGAVFAFYLMERQPDGAWKIAGVFLRSRRTERV